ncbi:hypothetical protein FLCU109888_00940 [Flavobacterium cucumis]|uniref:Uncharacterized protein n=1 Tax=Flavobacterium cucumis TaxID=416016 RepID=A0A1M7ZTP8_9FLAO|nr:hypothetical protein [Flavobacterium cucumis]SHO72252.1 hypothetical protein SAMN05443547_0580 [Flavobacterium cucumis]
MKKLIFILVLSLITSEAFAGNTEKEKSKEKKENSKEKNETMVYCCTATLTYNGQYYDQEEYCSNTPNGDNLNSSPNCIEAARRLSKRNPQILKSAD